MKYLSIVVAAALILLAAPLKAQSGPDSVSAMWHRGGDGQGSSHGDHGWQGRGNGGHEGGHDWQRRGDGGWQGDRGHGWNDDHGRNGDHERGWNRDEERGRGDYGGHWVWVETRRPVLRFHWAFGHMRWFWEWVTDSHREWHHWN